MFAFVSAPIDTPTLSPFPILPLAHSLRDNGIGAEGATALAAILNENTKLINLKCAATPLCEHFSLPLHVPIRVRKGTFVPFPTHSFLAPFRTHFFVPQNFLHSLANAHTPLPHSYPRDAALNRAPRGPRPRPPVGRVGRACSRAHLTPLRPPRRSLRGNNLDDEAKQAIEDAAAGSGVSIMMSLVDDDEEGGGAGSSCALDAADFLSRPRTGTATVHTTEEF